MRSTFTGAETSTPSYNNGGGIKDSPFLSPNLSTCQSTLSCCSALPDSELSAIDFEFPNQSSPIRIRRPAHLLTEDYISKYERAVDIMKSLPPDHPHNFRHQADIHCLYCTGAYQQTNSDVPFNVHRSWLFYPWHRFFLYFHERILAKLIGDDTFTLPYWNWDSPDGMTIPDMYLTGTFVDQKRDMSSLPPAMVPFDILPPPPDGNDLGAQHDQVAINLAIMYHQMVSGAKKPELFMGCPLRPGKAGLCDGAGTVETLPHNLLHVWLGDKSDPELKDMGAFYAAARDPIFYAHHANIDRLWTVWKKINGAESEVLDPGWLDSQFYFYDEHERLVRVKVRDCLDMTKLRYAYEEFEQPWLNARPKPSTDHKIARNILRSSIERSRKFKMQGPWALSKSVSVRVDRLKRPRKEEEEEVLVVDGIDVLNDTNVRFDVFINAIDGVILSPRSSEFAGTFISIRHGGASVRSSRKQTLKLGITELLKDIDADKDESIWVTLVLRGASGINITVDEIRIEYMT